jgi:hypothetical protein
MLHWIWLLSSLLLLPVGWFASAWHHQRKHLFLLRQLQAVRQQAAEHAAQARRQIGQLQADLASRPASARPRPEVFDAPAHQVDPVAERGRPELDHGFPATAVVPPPSWAQPFGAAGAEPAPMADQGFPVTAVVPPPLSAQRRSGMTSTDARRAAAGRAGLAGQGGAARAGPAFDPTDTRPFR